VVTAIGGGLAVGTGPAQGCAWGSDTLSIVAHKPLTAWLLGVTPVAWDGLATLLLGGRNRKLCCCVVVSGDVIDRHDSQEGQSGQDGAMHSGTL